MRFPQSRSYYIPRENPTTVEIKDDAAQSVAYTYEMAGKLYLMGFAGKAQKPSFHFRYSTVEKRAEAIATFFANQRARIQRRVDARKARSEFVHTLKVGDVLRSSWGYDQTNVDYYQVTALKGAKQVTVRRIGAVSETTGWETGKCAPDVGNFLDATRYPEQTFLVQQGNSIRVASYASAYPVACQKVGGLKVYETARWSSYA